MDHEEEEEDEDEEEEEESVWDTEEDDDDDDEDDDSSLMSDDTVIEATIPNYPVAVICMEHCECTMDKWIHDNETIPDEEWFAALFQIVMILLTYQKAFSFTHNDLHSNNIMFNTTSHKYLYYMYHKKIYKVPTFGKLFKIIDFGRAIFKFNGQLFCSDAFEQGADASAQYNFEPYFNEKKSRLDPNPSFDLCRLACSLFDYLVEDMDDIADIQRCSPLVRLMVEWCTDDNGINVLYKRDGTERYPDFKLYKMIAKCVHAHTPQAQLDRPMFAAYAIPKKTFEKDEKKGVMMMNIDSIPSFVSSSTDS
jgi:serine/threonine protein kinase